MNSLLGLLLLAFISNSCSLPTKTESEDGFWFPDPNNDGALIKAYLEDHGVGTFAGTVDDVHFYLYTKANPDAPVEVFIGDDDSLTQFDKIAPLKLISHGFGGNYLDGCSRSLRTAYLGLPDDLNVIVIDWSVLSANPWYHLAANNSKMAGDRAAELIDYLVENGYTTLEKVHSIGFSLGAHVAANAGGAVKNGRISRVTGLDPALPLFDWVKDEFRIDPTDATFVDVIHTAAGGLLEGGLAFMEPRGHVDLYPNGGRKQLGCEGEAFGSCSHGRACSYMAESILTTTEFTACKCTTWEGFENDECLCKVKTPMGEHLNQNTPHTVYWLWTNKQAPYARGDDMLKPPA